MFLAFVIYGSLSSPSGGYLYDRRMVEYLQRQGDKVEIVSLPWRNYARHLGDNFSISFHHRLANLRADLLIQDELNHPSLFWLNYRLREQPHPPLVSIVHHLRSSELRPAWQNRFYRRVEERYLRSLDGFIFNSQTTRQVVQDLLGKITCPPFTVAYPAGDRFEASCEPDEIERRAHEPGPLRLAFVGNLIPRKNLHTLLDALRLLPSGSWKLSVAGSQDMDPAYVKTIRRKVTRTGMEDRVQFLGHLSIPALEAMLRSSQVLIVPSSYEGFGIAYLEGMAFGLPAIASTTGAAGEIITHSADGFLVDPVKPEEIAACLGRLSSDRELLACMGIAALKRFLAHPTWEQTAEKIHSFLISLHP
jgi:glycosyltransferase involved in cell wall biosynthesis